MQYGLVSCCALLVFLFPNHVSKAACREWRVCHLMASLLYGSGLRLMECVRLRVKDVDFAYHQLTVRDGKGAQERVTMLPQS